MDKVVFPNSGRCIACHEIIPNDEFHRHTLNCRPISSLSDKKSCPFCKQTFDKNSFEEHLQICDQQVSSIDLLSKMSLIFIFLQKKSMNDDEEVRCGYVTPPSEINKQVSISFLYLLLMFSSSNRIKQIYSISRKLIQ